MRRRRRIRRETSLSVSSRMRRAPKWTGNAQNKKTAAKTIVQCSRPWAKSLNDRSANRFCACRTRVRTRRDPRRAEDADAAGPQNLTRPEEPDPDKSYANQGALRHSREKRFAGWKPRFCHLGPQTGILETAAASNTTCDFWGFFARRPPPAPSPRAGCERHRVTTQERGMIRWAQVFNKLVTTADPKWVSHGLKASGGVP